MFSLKNLIFQLLVLAIIAALTNCSPSDRLSGGVSRRSELATDNAVPASASSGNINVLNKAQFEASGLTLITPGPVADNPNGNVRCETSNASPSTSNARGLANWFSNFFGWYCCNWNVNGGGCSHMMTVGDASTAMCGNQGCIVCEDVYSNIYRIVEFCQRDGKVGGVSFLDQGSHLVLY
ncbi:hypothetical protein B9Z19DRAFT_1064526 [Tuber borchii]|uniref:Cyanovirin-N domain-containing protein n=1 Tax=Tuber borchii TaxID=42251 RepID=A0A2T6ZU82_TUBBO|nr:hypothetical protein B9Z19DRAFT_1064526 [Tuber borchii]